ncbi:hypothetical protein, partial [Streptomyces mirabilis]
LKQCGPGSTSSTHYDPGFDFSVLSEFRDRLAGADAGRRVLDVILVAAREKRQLKNAGPHQHQLGRTVHPARAAGAEGGVLCQ